jgi:metal-responsive CopG/Arc/MetJ family transcriptional regulator
MTETEGEEIQQQQKAGGANRCVGFNVSMPLSELAKLDRAANLARVSRSEWIRKAVKHYHRHLRNEASTGSRDYGVI